MTAIAIFVKTPGLSPIKTRLAADVGPTLAVECHLRCARSVAAVARAAAIGPVYWAVAEAEGAQYPAWQGLPILVQRGFGLGERMQSIHDELIRRHGRAMLLGADLPQLDSADLVTASARLREPGPQVVIGPAGDGGFWLIAANRALPATVWRAPDYACADVMQRFVAAAGDTSHWTRLAVRTDLDRAGDLAAVIDELRRLRSPHELQAQLVEWLAELPDPLHSRPEQRSDP